jgi:hypothetical protein
MRSIEIIKETEDIRPNRSKVLKVGTRFQCLNEIADKYIKKKLAKEVEPDVIRIDEEKQLEKLEDKE